MVVFSDGISGRFSREEVETIPGEAASHLLLEKYGKPHDDATALVGCTLDGHVFVVGVWEKPEGASDEWVVPRDRVDVAVNEAFKRWKVVEMPVDRSKWFDQTQIWWERYGDVVVDMAPTRQRMVPACAGFYSAVVQNQITHDGNPDLTRHLSNAVVKETPDGAYITKDGRWSPRKIDLAVAAVMAFDRATFPSKVKPIRPRIIVPDEED